MAKLSLSAPPRCVRRLGQTLPGGQEPQKAPVREVCCQILDIYSYLRTREFYITIQKSCPKHLVNLCESSESNLLELLAPSLPPKCPSPRNWGSRWSCMCLKGWTASELRKKTEKTSKKTKKVASTVNKTVLLHVRSLQRFQLGPQTLPKKAHQQR